MRVTAQTRAATRQRILKVAQELLASRGFDATTTRDIARAAGIATGTMFNYFPSKEAVVGSLAAAALDGVAVPPRGGKREGASLEEDLFAHVAAGLRRLRPLRKHLPILFATALNPAFARLDDDCCRLRDSHLEAVVRLTREHGMSELPPTALQIYWSLYAGLLVFWAGDTSHREEDTLALLDHSLSMFVHWLTDSLPATANKER